MRFSNRGQALLLLHERRSRLLLAWRPGSKAADPIAAAIARMLGPLAIRMAAELTAVIRAYHNTPRQCLGYRTPAAAFAAGVLHLKM